MPPSSEMPLQRQRAYSYLSCALRSSSVLQEAKPAQERNIWQREAQHPHQGIALALKRMQMEGLHAGEGLWAAEGMGHIFCRR